MDEELLEKLRRLNAATAAKVEQEKALAESDVQLPQAAEEPPDPPPGLNASPNPES